MNSNQYFAYLYAETLLAVAKKLLLFQTPKKTLIFFQSFGRFFGSSPPKHCASGRLDLYVLNYTCTPSDTLLSLSACNPYPVFPIYTFERDSRLNFILFILQNSCNCVTTL